MVTIVFMVRHRQIRGEISTQIGCPAMLIGSTTGDPLSVGLDHDHWVYDFFKCETLGNIKEVISNCADTYFSVLNLRVEDIILVYKEYLENTQFRVLVCSGETRCISCHRRGS